MSRPPPGSPPKRTSPSWTALQSASRAGCVDLLGKPSLALGEAEFDVAQLDSIGRQIEGAPVLGRGLFPALEPAEQMALDGGEQVIPGQRSPGVDSLDDRQARGRSASHRHCDGSIQL